MQSKGLSRVFSNTTVQGHQFCGDQSLQSVIAIAQKKKEKKTQVNRTFSQLKTLKNAINKVKGQPTEWEKIFASLVSDKGLTL